MQRSQQALDEHRHLNDFRQIGNNADLNRSRSIKRSTAIALIVLGGGTAALIASSQSRVCHNDRGEEVPCRSSRSGSSYFGWSSGSSTSSNSTRQGQSTVQRGGFGSSGSGFSGS